LESDVCFSVFLSQVYLSVDSYNEITTELAVRRTEVEELTGEKESLDGVCKCTGSDDIVVLQRG
jgi:hypothetical protein